VHHAGNSIDVDAAGGNIGCDQYLYGPTGEVGQCSVALALIASPMNGGCSHPEAGDRQQR
jgi:hypothetical protein